MADVMRARAPESRQDVISAILDGYGSPLEEDYTAPPPPVRRKGKPGTLKLNKPLPTVGNRFQLRVDNAGTRSARGAGASEDIVEKGQESPQIVSKSIARNGKPSNLNLSASNGSTASPTSQGNTELAGKITTRSAPAVDPTSPPSNARDRYLPDLSDKPPPPPKTDVRRNMGASQSKGLPSNPRDLTGRIPVDSIKSKFTGKRKPVASSKTDLPNSSGVPSPASIIPVSTSPGSRSKPLPPIGVVEQTSVTSTQPSSAQPSSTYSVSTLPSSVLPSAHSRDTSSVLKTPPDKDSMSNASEPPTFGSAQPANVKQAALPDPGMAKEEGNRSHKEIPRKPSPPTAAAKPKPIGLPSGPKQHFRGKSSTGFDKLKQNTLVAPNSYTNELSPPPSAGVSPTSEDSGAYPQYNHPSLKQPPATPDSTSESRSLNLPPQRLNWIYLANRPASCNAPPLTAMHTNCFMQHATFRPNSNRVHPIACMLCYTDGGERLMCTYCCLRICRHCVTRLTSIKGRDVKQIIDLRQAKSVLEASGE